MTTVQMLVNHFLITNGDHTARVEFSDLTPEEEAELRAIAAAQRQPRNPKRARKQSRSRAGSQPSNRVNYAELVAGRDVAGVNENKLPPFCDYCHTNHYGYQDHYLG